jgi:hypothetical protein
MAADAPQAPTGKSTGPAAGDSGPIPAVRWWRTGFRAAHLVAFGALYGGHVYGVPEEKLMPALVATVGTGFALMGLDIVRAPIWLVQVRGLATATKIALIGLAAARPAFAVPLLTLTIVIGAVSSHMPGRWRYHSLWHGRVVGPREKG